MLKMRSIMYIPGNRPEYISNIPNLKADVFMLDVEDSVPENEKQTARENIGEYLEYYSGYVRINGWSTGLTNQDLNYVVRKGLLGVCLTKCGEVGEVKELDTRLYAMESARGIDPGTIKVQLLIETAKAIMNVYRLALSSERVNSLVFGVVDYTTDMGIPLNQPNGVEYEYARQIVACAAIAANVIPVDSPYMKIKDTNGFVEDTKHSIALGYRGRLAIHPAQIELENEFYSPSKESVAWAREIVAAFEADGLNNKKAAISYKGEMIATAVYNNARKILKYNEAFQ
jgi:citrate lyase subunit beta/citryl-CoA lyase